MSQSLIIISFLTVPEFFPIFQWTFFNMLEIHNDSINKVSWRFFYMFLKRRKRWLQFLANLILRHNNRSRYDMQLPVTLPWVSVGNCLVMNIGSHPMPAGGAADKVPCEISAYALVFWRHPSCVFAFLKLDFFFFFFFFSRAACDN